MSQGDKSSGPALQVVPHSGSIEHLLVADASPKDTASHLAFLDISGKSFGHLHIDTCPSPEPVVMHCTLGEQLEVEFLQNGRYELVDLQHW